MIDLLVQNTVTISRRIGAVIYVDGYPVEGEWQTSAARGSVQPAPATVLKMLPEGDRVRDPKVIYTKTEMRLGDRITLENGDVFEVVEVSNWSDSSLAASHYRAVMLRVER